MNLERVGTDNCFSVSSQGRTVEHKFDPETPNISNPNYAAIESDTDFEVNQAIDSWEDVFNQQMIQETDHGQSVQSGLCNETPYKG